MPGHYLPGSSPFTLFRSPDSPGWRPPQRGALGALLAYWSLPHRAPALVSLPTGSGKTAVAAAAPYLAGSRRVLVVVPSTNLRQQIARDIRSESVLIRVGAREGDSRPIVLEARGRFKDWSQVYEADVVVSHPNSISPLGYKDAAPPSDLFDTIIIDEAHHTPAPTWRAILDHFSVERSLLLTATPQRTDGQRLPGELIYHYPLRQALDEGFYKPVQPRIITLASGASQSQKDRTIAQEVLGLLAEPAHSTSGVLVRAATVDRARALVDLYSSLGLEVTLLHSGMLESDKISITNGLYSGSIRAVAVVDMLGEGFDLPSLRIAAYHDKHRSVNATMQLIGRLVRSHPSYPQDSILVTARDEDVYPQLQGVVRQLWAEDPDWTVVLPGVIDEQIKGEIANRDYASAFQPAPPELSIESITPVMRTIVYEVPVTGWEPAFLRNGIPEGLAPGQTVRGRTVLYTATTPSATTLLCITTTLVRPRWHAHPGLDTPEYGLHLVTWGPARQTDQSHLLIVNSEDASVARGILDVLDASEHVTAADPGRLQDAFDSLARVSVSNVGLRNTYMSSRGVASYRTFAGSGVDLGLRDADTARGALGHAMAQVSTGSDTFTAGIATGKSKLWQTRKVPLREYETLVADLVGRYWYPPGGGPGRLLPTVAREERLLAFPTAPVAAIEVHHALYGRDWTLDDGTPLDILDLRQDAPVDAQQVSLPIAAYSPADPQSPVWRGRQDLQGRFMDTSGPLTIRRGYGHESNLADVLTDYPPNIYFQDGQSVQGPGILHSLRVDRHLPTLNVERPDWTGVDLTRETRRSATSMKPIHEALEDILKARPKTRRHRWIVCNDGAGEIADYLVLEIDPGPNVRLSLWHAKGASGNAPSVRVDDMQVVTAQAIKSRRWVTDSTLWSELGERLTGTSSPRLRIVEGSERLLRVLTGQNSDHEDWSLTKRPPRVADCEIGIVQPGLSYEALTNQLQQSPVPTSAQQIRDLLAVWHDAIAHISSATLIVSR